MENVCCACALAEAGAAGGGDCGGAGSDAPALGLPARKGAARGGGPGRDGGGARGLSRGLRLEPVETLHLQLPEDLSAEWRDYLKLQQSQGLPFGDYAGCEAERYTYNILNYPGVERGVQANIFVADGIVIAGDVVSTGEQSFQQGLAFPESGG